jgi:hypothetical protein
MKKIKQLLNLIVFAVVITHAGLAQNRLFEFDNNHLSTRWSSPENLNGIKGAAGKENNGAKGRAFGPVEAKGAKTLLDVQGTGIVNRIWITINDRSPEMLRSLVVKIFWDNEQKPAVNVPFGDFFGIGLGQITAFQNALFANPEGRSFECFIAMPFKKAAKIQVVNESDVKLSYLFYDVDFQYLKTWKPEYLYFHAWWHRDTATTITKDFELLPNIKGKGRFIGTNADIHANPVYSDAWWGEGEVKMYIDETGKLPTIAGTGTEDYIGTGWGQGKFINNFSGCTVADKDQKQWAWYRYHIPDPIYFEKECRVTLQQIGGEDKETVAGMQKTNVPLIPVTVDESETLHHYYSPDSVLQVAKTPFKEGWVNFYRTDDVSSTAYFYLDAPSNNLPVLQPIAVRTYKLKNQK